MADRGSWRNRNEESSGNGGGGGGGGSSNEGVRDTIKAGSTSSDMMNATGSSQLSNNRQSNLHAIRRSKADEFGPAAPLQPLHISAGRPLPHPSSYAGTDNWAFTPSDTLPSLPATPSRAMHVLGWNRASTPAAGGEVGNNAGPSGGQVHHVGQSSEMNNRYPQSTPSRDKSAALGARAVLNKRMEDQRNYSPSPVRNQRPSPRIGMNSMGSPSQIAPRSSNFGISTSSTDVPTTSPTSSGQTQSIAAVLNQANSSNEIGSPAMMPALRHRDSIQSIASSTNQSLGQHMLAHSRRPSQVFTASPAMSNATGSSNVRPTAPYRVYRPPHLRTESYLSLQPKVAHYDRVSAPMLRGQSRSPSVSRSRSDSVSVSRTPSESNFSSISPRIGPRRLSNLSSQELSQANQNQTLPGYGTGFDSNSLIAKLANAKLDLSGRTSVNSPSMTDDQNQEILDDVDLSVEDMMMSGTLTDQYYRSRTASISSTQGALVDIFEIGDRLGPKMMHDGHEITIAQTSDGFNEQSADWTGTQLEIVSKLGEGSYAVVYLVKEVPRMEGLHQISVTPVTLSSTDRSRDVFLDEGDQTFADETILQNGDLYGTTIKASASGRLAENKEDEDHSKSSKKSEGRYFALKCLCKRDLSDDMLEVQRLESTIHQSIPRHPNIVTLYRTYETPEWLFLVLEYCPGQDLFYWLEQAHDTENLGAATPGGNSDEADADLTTMDSTPPSPSLLASTNSRFLLSRRRLKLISRMFQQICEAVGFCHDRGISHRDIKPENFIVEDTRGSEFAGNGENQNNDLDVNQIQVKLTDFGLAVAQTRCIDFDCGSKPYMSYECRNNTLRWYNPIESDIWSLGIVLLNLIFHRNPFMEPNMERCPSFASYVQDPVRFLTTAFRGLKREAAQFLAEKVFCDVTEGEDESQRRHRISAREFGDWASNLADHLESHESKGKMLSDHSTNFLSPNMDTISAGADVEITSPLWHSRSPTSSIVNSLMASPASNSKSINIYQELANMGISEEEIDSFTPLFTDTITAPENRPKEPSTMTETSLEPIAETIGSVPSSTERRSTDIEQQSVNNLSIESPISNEANDFEENEHSTVETSVENEGGIHEDEEEDQTDKVSERDDQSIFPPASVTSTSANSKRRKRGARKGRTLAKQQLKRSHSAENLHTEEEQKSKTTESARDQVIRELAEASQSLAREMSKAIQSRGDAANSDFTSATAVDMPALSASRHTISPQTAMELKELQTRLAVPEFDAATTTISSLNSISRGSTTSHASSHFTNYGWGDSRRIGSNIVSDGNSGRQDESISPQMHQSNVSLLLKNKLPGNTSQGAIGTGGGARHVLQDSGRGRTAHPSSTAADWRERNTSNASLASISSINTLNSYSSDIGSIHSTASAPPAMMTHHHHRRGGSGLSSLQNYPQTNSSASSARSVGLSGMRTGGGSSNASIASRNINVPGSRNLGTINERGNSATAQSNLDASYLASIFGGKGPQSSHSRNQKGEVRAPSHAGKGFVGGVLDTTSARGSFASQRSLNDNRSNLDSIRGGSENESSISLDRSESSESFANHDNISAPRKKMLGKFLQGVKNYNKGVKAAPAMPSDDQESSDTGTGTETSAGASSGTPSKSTPTASSAPRPKIRQGSGMHIQMQ
ncbi:hypothetical protein L7F22_019623 [Adiantum nelumboides]|nr:hypothetical protein [Adiantum nelumboides]